MDNLVYKSELTSLVRNRMMDNNTEIFSESFSGRKYSIQIAISIKGSKITEKAEPKDLT